MPGKNPSVSFVIPLYNAEQHIINVVTSVLKQDYPGIKEIIVINDGSTDRSRDLLREFEKEGKIRVMDQQNCGAAAATNAGFRAARYGIICSIDSDVVLHHDWLDKIIEEFDDPQVAAVQGYYRTPKSISLLGRVMGYDVEKRYDSIQAKYVSQVCTGDTAYRKSAVERTGLFDPDFVYGYDNDMSYRLMKAGYKLVFRKDALCDHYWKADLKKYVRQQYHSAFGRMQLIKKHRERITGDSVSGLRMILQVPVTLTAVSSFLAAGAVSFFGSSLVSSLVATGLALLALLFVDRIVFAVSVYKKQRDIAAVLLPGIHLLRNLVWVSALLHWMVKGSKRKA